uniref:ATP synthase subunit a n=1 Tax=Melanastera paucipunctata TaxID=2218046 RepID=A0A344A296_9HEMI|nr:ATP synthase F0 subunit 6 [Diclidophlebia paucipunctata]AWU48887.1 ATP synthase F0 subunit 6 [Diclidophlebia paucipunctata]
MMTSLFSMFDPTSSFNTQINWILSFLTTMFIPSVYWELNSRTNLINKLILLNLNKEFYNLYSKSILSKGSTLICISLFMLILLNNISSNFPYTFCCSAHLAFSISLSVPIWLSLVIFYWINLTKTMLSHLVPSGTPSILMPLMVMIEMTSNIIRPTALAVRLTANLIAGHLLMALLGNTLNINSIYWPVISTIQIMFMLFEIMVAIIQSYVFSILMTLYSSEIS